MGYKNPIFIPFRSVKPEDFKIVDRRVYYVHCLPLLLTCHWLAAIGMRPNAPISAIAIKVIYVSFHSA